jgi:hypothetical protein
VVTSELLLCIEDFQSKMVYYSGPYYKLVICVRVYVSTAVKMYILAFWVMTVQSGRCLSDCTASIFRVEMGHSMFLCNVD